MNVKIIESEDYNGDIIEELFINGESMERIAPLWECPEDAIIGRDLISATTIADYMKLAYDACKNGEEFVINIEEE